jgi:psp operon transcriptional activator
MSDDYSTNSDSPIDASAIHEALGQTDIFLDFQERLSKVAQVNRPVLLIGERGTGKELAAKRVHFLSRRWQGPFVALNCAALSPTLIEAELFGHEAGAFTGASSMRRGRFEAAHEGTLFLDEIGTIPLEAQEKIMRAVEYSTFERVGSSQPVQVDVRIVGATNANLQLLTAQGKFMPDLLDRLSFDVLVLPPLRDRLDDIPLLANHFAARMAHELEWQGMPEITDDAMETLIAFDWPGNVRELKNVIERAVYRSDDDLITKEELIFNPFEAYTRTDTQTLPASESVQPYPPMETQPDPEVSATTTPTAATPANPAAETASDDTRSFTEAVRELELRLLRKALHQSQFNQKKAADAMDLSYHQFRGLYRKYQDDLKEG